MKIARCNGICLIAREGSLMKRWLAHVTIVAYLCCLAYGVGTHALKTKAYASPAMYFIVWDMFCGWAGYSQRYHMIAEGESGQFYDVGSEPWGEFYPYGYLGRRHYDPTGNNVKRFAMNILKHTSHEPMKRVYIIEENWSKKYNIPDAYWAEKYEEPKEQHSYFYTRQILDGNGLLLNNFPNWASYQSSLIIMDNPRFLADAKRKRTFYAVNTRPLAKQEYQAPDSQHLKRSASLNGN